MVKKVCPLISGSVFNGPTGNSMIRIVYCIEEDCAFWVPEQTIPGACIQNYPGETIELPGRIVEAHCICLNSYIFNKGIQK
jgi:hypothetical protein